MIATNGTIKYVQCILVRKAYPSNHLPIVIQANGTAITNAITSSTANSLYNNLKILNTDAPNTFLMPISLVRCIVVNEARPNKPKQATNIANTVNNPNTCPKR